MAGYQRQASANIAPDLPIMAEDINAEFNAIEAALNASTGHSHDGSPGEGAPISLTSAVSGVLPIASGGTNATTASAARSNLGLGTAAVVNTGTSGSTIPLLNANNTHSGNLTVSGDFAATGVVAIKGTTVNSFSSGLLSNSSASAWRTSLGLGSLATASPTGTPDGSKFLRDDNTWASPGTVSSVAVSVPTGLSVSGSPITTSGTIAITYASGYEGFTTTLKNKLDGIQAGAQVNPASATQSVWNTGTSGVEYTITPVKLHGVIDTKLADAIMDGDFSANGMMARTAAGTYASRTITAGTGIGVTNGNGASGNPTVALSSGAQASLALADGSLQASNVASFTEYNTATSSKVLDTDSVWSSLAVLTDASTIAINLNDGYDFGGASSAALAIAGNRTLGSPTNARNGKKGVVWITASGATRTLTLHADWKLAQDVEAGPYSITTSQTLGIAYVCFGSIVVVTGIVRI